MDFACLTPSWLPPHIRRHRAPTRHGVVGSPRSLSARRPDRLWPPGTRLPLASARQVAPRRTPVVAAACCPTAHSLRQGPRAGGRAAADRSGRRVGTGRCASADRPSGAGHQSPLSSLAPCLWPVSISGVLSLEWWLSGDSLSPCPWFATRWIGRLGAYAWWMRLFCLFCCMRWQTSIAIF